MGRKWRHGKLCCGRSRHYADFPIRQVSASYPALSEGISV